MNNKHVSPMIQDSQHVSENSNSDTAQTDELREHLGNMHKLYWYDEERKVKVPLCDKMNEHQIDHIMSLIQTDRESLCIDAKIGEATKLLHFAESRVMILAIRERIASLESQKQSLTGGKAE